MSQHVLLRSRGHCHVGRFLMLTSPRKSINRHSLGGRTTLCRWSYPPSPAWKVGSTHPWWNADGFRFFKRCLVELLFSRLCDLYFSLPWLLFYHSPMTSHSATLAIHLLEQAITKVVVRSPANEHPNVPSPRFDRERERAKWFIFHRMERFRFFAICEKIGKRRVGGTGTCGSVHRGQDVLVSSMAFSTPLAVVVLS